MASDDDRRFMQRAIELSVKAGIVEKTGKCFGAVVVKDGNIVGEGYNRVFSDNDPTWHGEMHAIRNACKNLGSPSLEGCTIYSSTYPCPMCTAAIYWSRIAKCFYGAEDEDVNKYGAFETGGDYSVVLFHNREDKLPPQQRTGVPFVSLMREEAAEVFKQYRELPESERPCY